VDVVASENPTDIGSIRGARSKPLDGRLLVSERLQEGERELIRIERLHRKAGDGLLNLDQHSSVIPSSLQVIGASRL